MPCTIAFLNKKGGVGKTSTCHHLAGTLARQGRRILLLDADPQASLTQGFWGPEAMRDDSRGIVSRRAVRSGVRADPRGADPAERTGGHRPRARLRGADAVQPPRHRAGACTRAACATSWRRPATATTWP